ncbi:MAG TPA: energy transducer TonB [Candidatus Angelobacter sp.]|nr:energy transducer TonB [Candidatus Angelobacter sp.]
MNNVALYDELDQAIDQLLAAPDAAFTHPEPNVGELVELASDLRYLPGANFKTRLRLELEWEAAGRTVSAAGDAHQLSHAGHAAKVAIESRQILPSLFGKTWAGYPMKRVNFALSVALHGVMALVMGAGFLMVKSYAPRVDRNSSVSVRLEPYVVPIGSHPSHGGGSGGAAEKTLASRGAAPRGAREQLTPPIVLHENMQHSLVAEATVIAPPDLNLTKTPQTGDPLSALAAPSNGPGASGGIGGRVGGGVGIDGSGPGRGTGSGGGCCGDLYSIGNGVSMPRAIYSPEPEFSEEARKTKHQGEVILLATIGADGRPRNLTVIRSLGMGLDEKALETVRTWKFEPAKKDGRPVAVQMNIILNFNLF